MAYIYTYTNKDTGKTYIGSRCSYKGRPEDDFNIRYFSSSENPEFKKDMSEGKLQGNIILEISNPDQCVKLENMMIKAYWEQYGKDKSYNRGWCIGKKRQFSTTGLKRPGRVAWNKGLHTGPQSEETKKKKSEQKKGDKNPMYRKHPWNYGLHTPYYGGGSKKGSKPKKHTWKTPDGSIVIMGTGQAHRFHPDWILIK